MHHKHVNTQHGDRRFHHDHMIHQFRANLNQVGVENDDIQSIASSITIKEILVQCQYCFKEISPIKDRSPTTKTHIAAAILCLFFCVPFVFLPYGLDWFSKPVSRCPNCEAVLAEIGDDISEESITSRTRRNTKIP